MKKPEVVGLLENAPSVSGSDEDEFDLLREDEYECMLFARQAKKWADSLICTLVTLLMYIFIYIIFIPQVPFRGR